MLQHQQRLVIPTQPQTLHDITQRVEAIVHASGIAVGLCTVFVQHTSASLLIQENADPSVLADLERWMKRLAPETERWEHRFEGKDDMPAHARCAITRTSESIPISDGRLALGQWQGLYLWEHRATAHRRGVIVHVIGA